MSLRGILPLAVFLLLLALLAAGLKRDPTKVESPLVGKPVPYYSLPSLKDPNVSVSLASMQGQVALLNVWASWCFACRDEHPILLAIADSGIVPIYGFNYKDTRPKALRWLNQLGDPYINNAFDESGRVAIDLGVYGAPETFLLDQDGVIAYKHIGPITPSIWQQTLLPMINQLKAQTP